MIYTGDSLEVLKTLDENSIDSIVTDPPYGLSFMGKKWDYDVPSKELWQEVLRVLKPGGHLLSFAGSRTYHRMAVNIEDAGFEIRDQIMWVYGSGFPKSHNIGKAVDKLQGNEREDSHEVKFSDGAGMGLLDKSSTVGKSYTETKGNSPYEGWGTALKPAHEPIVVARKPFKGTVAENTLKWGTGGINIDESRVETDENLNGGAYSKGEYDTTGKTYELGLKRQEGNYKQPQGRFPANFIHDGSDEVVGLLGEPSRFFYSPKAGKSERNKGLEEFEEVSYANNALHTPKEGSIAKYGLEEAKKRLAENSTNKNHHPTVKPIKLMQYLVRLVTPKDGVCLDPFNGSGTTGIACKLGGFEYIGIEREQEYVDISNARIEAWEQEPPKLI